MQQQPEQNADKRYQFNLSYPLIRQFLQAEGEEETTIRTARDCRSIGLLHSDRLTALLLYRPEAWESQVLDKRIARLMLLTGGTAANRRRLLRQFIHTARHQGADLITVRVEADNQRDIQLLEREHFVFVDGLLTLSMEGIEGVAAPAIRIMTAADLEAVQQIAAGTFVNSRFYGDPKLSTAAADRLYRRWTVNNFRGRADRNWVAADQRGQVLGFIQCRTVERWLIIDLLAVKKGCGSRGVGSSLVRAALSDAVERGIRRAQVGTQLGNIAAVRLYERCGFRLVHASVTLHRWLDS